MKPQVESYLRRFEEWATALKARYVSDLFFKTSLNVAVVSAGFVALCLVSFGISLYLGYLAWYLFIGSVLFGGISWVALVRAMLRPARDTLHYQKLFISNVAHELRTPLAVIKTETEVALLDDSLNPNMRKVLVEIMGELDRISEIINNLLSLNKLNRPERIEFQSIDLSPVLEKAVRPLQSLARERGIE